MTRPVGWSATPHGSKPRRVRRSGPSCATPLGAGTRHRGHGAFPGHILSFNLPALRTRPMAPVLICEGEKAAEAASQQFPDWVAVSSLHGAKAPQKSDWSSVATRDVTIWPDADEAGARFAATVAQLVHEAGAASVRIVPVPNEMPAGWDLADPLPEGMDLAALLASARKPETEAGEDRDELAHLVSRLAALPPHEYDRCRKKEAHDLGVRTLTLDKASEGGPSGSAGRRPSPGACTTGLRSSRGPRRCPGRCCSPRSQY